MPTAHAPSRLPIPPRRDRLPINHPLPAVYRLLDDRAEAPPPGEGVRDPALATVEAVLLVADEPLPARRIAKAAGLADAAQARQAIRKLQELYDLDQSAFQVEELAGGFQLLTRPQFHRWLVRLRSGVDDLRLSGAARETLAIVAYRQPIMRADIEGIRGVHCGDILAQLMEKGLLRITGRHDSLGRPVLYGTTRKFLQIFGLKTLKDLPQVEELPAPPATPAEEG